MFFKFITDSKGYVSYISAIVLRDIVIITEQSDHVILGFLEDIREIRVFDSLEKVKEIISEVYADIDINSPFNQNKEDL